MKNHTSKTAYTGGGYYKRDHFLLFRLGAISTACFAVMLAPAWGEDSPAQEQSSSLLEKAYDLEEKGYVKGVLSFLNEELKKKIEVDRVSSFFLSEIADTSTFNPSELMDGVFLRFDVQKDVWYYDRRTGMPQETPEEGSSYREVEIKRITEHYFEFAFKDTVFALGEPYAPDTENPGKTWPRYIIGTGSESVKTAPINYTLDTHVFDFRYNESDLKETININAREKIADISGVFKERIKNENVETNKFNYENVSGGALWLKGCEIDNIKADFIKNKSVYYNGGAIMLLGGSKINETIEGTFIGNEAHSEGGAIWAYGNGSGYSDLGGLKIEHINGVFIDNGVVDKITNSHRGGAILIGGSTTTANIVEGLFIANHVTSGVGSEDGGAVGGAIGNGEKATINWIIGDFIGNYIDHPGNDGHGGAIMNYKEAKIENIIGDFYGNNVQGQQGYGGAIANQNRARIEAITGGFVRNHVTTGKNEYAAAGGAIYNNRGATIGEISGNFIRNYVENDSLIWGDVGLQNGFVSGGAIANYYNEDTTQHSTIDTIVGKFYGNFAKSKGNSYAQGGAISNTGKAGAAECVIKNISGDFIGNYAEANGHFARGGAIFTDTNSRIDKISGNFYYNYAYSKEGSARGGAIRNGGKLGEIENAAFVGNYAWSVNGEKNGIKQKLEDGEHLHGNAEKNSEWNHLVAATDADYTKGAHGGAIFNEGELKISANKGNTTLFAGNYIVNGEINEEKYRDYEAIYCYSDSENTSKLTLESIEKSYIIFEDKISGGEDIGYDLYLTGDNSSYIIFNNLVEYATIEMEDINLILFGEPREKGMRTESYLPAEVRNEYDHSDVFRKSMLEVHSGTVMLADGVSTEYLIGELRAYGSGNAEEHAGTAKKGGEGNYTINDFATFTIDADIDKETADVLTVFAVQGENGDAWYKDPQTEHVSLSQGRVKISGIEVRSEEGEWQYMAKLQKGLTLQVINFIVMDSRGEDAKEVDAEIYKDYQESCPIELDELDELVVAKSKMNSAHILPESISLATTKTHNDSIFLMGFRDNLQSWADLDENGRWVETEGFGSIQYDNYEAAQKAGDAHKVFTILLGEQRLTQSSNGGNGGVWGAEWTIRGRDRKESMLNLNGLKLLNIVKKEQKAHLENFYLRNTKDWTLENLGELTLDTMDFDTSRTMTIDNKGTLTVRGLTNLTGIIESGELAANRSMVIDNKSTYTTTQAKKDEANAAKPAAAAETEETKDSGYTYVQILGTVKDQNITVEGTGSVKRVKNNTTDTYDTVAALQVMSNGETTEQFNRFTNNSLTMNSGKFVLQGGLGSADLRLRQLTIGGGSIMAGIVDVDLENKKMGTIKADSYGAYAGKGGHIFVNGLRLTSSSDANYIVVEFTDSLENGGIPGAVTPFSDEELNHTEKETSERHYVYDKIVEWGVKYNYETGEYIFTKTYDKNKELDDKIADLEQEKKKVEEEREKLERRRKELEQKEKELEQKEKELEQKEKELDELEKDLRRKQRNLEEKQQELKETQDALDSTAKEVEEAQRQVEQAQQEVQKAQQEVQKAQKAVDAARSELENMRDELTERASQLDELEKTLREREEELKRREEELANATPPAGSLHFNPAIMAGPVAEMMGGYASMQEVFNHSFEHAELFSATLNRARKARISERNYTQVDPVKGSALQPASRSAASASSLAAFKGGMWVRPYSSFERIAVYDGIKANVSLYGALVGGDTRLSEYHSGWASVFSAFAGYTGSTQRFSRRDSSVRTVQNGGVVGVTETLYYRNFYTALTASVGSASAHASTTWGYTGPRGGENYRMTMAGVASRSGYNVEMAHGRYVIQPTWQMSLTTIDMPDYTNADGVRVSSDTLCAFQIHPYIKAVMNTESGWNPFITVGYVHDFSAETRFYADGYRLPSVTIDPYAEYSIGVQKTWLDAYTLYGQATGRSGGRNGVEFSAGLRCAW